jgi:hypothetical protein
MQFQRNISLLLRIMEARRRVEFTGVELTGDAELTALEEKATAGGPVEKAVLGLHTVRVKRELCVGKFLPGRCELRTGEFRPSHGELARRSTRCARVDSARAASRELHAGELHPGCGELGRLHPGRDQCGRLRRARDELGRPWRA